MVALATVADCEDRLGSSITDADQRTRLASLLDDASAAIRTYTGRSWDTGTVERVMRPSGSYVRLPRGGTYTITAVVDAVSGVDVPYQFDGLDRIYLWPPLFRDGFERDFTGIPATVRVSYTATSVVPPAIVAVCCQMAIRAYGLDPKDSGHQQESIVGYSYSVGVAAASGGIGMLPDERRVLDAFSSVGGTAWLAVQ